MLYDHKMQHYRKIIEHTTVRRRTETSLLLHHHLTPQEDFDDKMNKNIHYVSLKKKI